MSVKVPPMWQQGNSCMLANNNPSSHRIRKCFAQATKTRINKLCSYWQSVRAGSQTFCLCSSSLHQSVGGWGGGVGGNQIVSRGGSLNNLTCAVYLYTFFNVCVFESMFESLHCVHVLCVSVYVCYMTACVCVCVYEWVCTCQRVRLCFPVCACVCAWYTQTRVCVCLWHLKGCSFVPA